MSLAVALGVSLFVSALSAQSAPIPGQKPDYRAAMAGSAGGSESTFQSIGSTATQTATVGTGNTPENTPENTREKNGVKINRHVVDQAKILDRDSQFLLTKALAEFKAQRKVQVVLMTTDSLQGYSIDAYSTAVARQWNIATTAEDPGVLVVLAPKEQVIKIHVGPGLNTWMPDRLADHIIAAYMIPHFRVGDWQRGLINGSAGIISVLGRDQPLTEQDVSHVITSYHAGIAAQNSPVANTGTETATPAVAVQTQPANEAVRPAGGEVFAANEQTSTASGTIPVAPQNGAQARPETGPASMFPMLLWPLSAVLLALLAGGFFFFKGRKVASLTGPMDDIPGAAS